MNEIAATLLGQLCQHRQDNHMKAGLALHIFCIVGFYLCSKGHRLQFPKMIPAGEAHEQECH